MKRQKKKNITSVFLQFLVWLNKSSFTFHPNQRTYHQLEARLLNIESCLLWLPHAVASVPMNPDC